ncbi:hypothetical protein [Terrabacter carboxydivorans]|uniref:Uncharacterized protein n=1 Tax=Terrabacter carboxydivorans TaxID=619730 RepID=A0ABP5Y056_9MICO
MTADTTPHAWRPGHLFDWAADASRGDARRIIIEGPRASGRTKAALFAKRLLKRQGMPESRIAMLDGADLDSSLTENSDAWWSASHQAIIIDDADYWVAGLDPLGFEDPDRVSWCEDHRRALVYAMDDLRAIRDKAVLVTIRDQSSLESAIEGAASHWAQVERITLPEWRAPAGVVSRPQLTW